MRIKETTSRLINPKSAIRDPHSARPQSEIRNPKSALRGITWAHTRGFAPLAATAQAFTDFHPEVEILWDKRSLWAFGEGDLAELAAAYDLIVFDYPFTGVAAEGELFLPLDEHLPRDVLAAQERESVGPSFRSYQANNHQWALALDAAAQVAASRPDLLEEHALAVPQTWNEVIELARATRRVATSFSRMGTLGMFFTLCANQGGAPFGTESHVITTELGRHVLAQLQTFFRLVDPGCLDMSPVAILSKMAATDEILYAPLLYGYSNYARSGYASHPLAFHDIPAAGERGSAGATLGGAGLAVSALSANQALALEYAAWVTSTECQRTLYTLSGGQPGNAVAWEDELTNKVTNNFFCDTRATLDRAFMRPNYAAYHDFQTVAATHLRAFLKEEQTSRETLVQLDDVYVRSRGSHTLRRR